MLIKISVVKVIGRLSLPYMICIDTTTLYAEDEDFNAFSGLQQCD